VDVYILVLSPSNIFEKGREMNWADVGSTVKHVVVRKDPGIFIHVLCKRQFKFYPKYIKRRKPMVHCLNCIAALKKLIHDARFSNNKLEK